MTTSSEATLEGVYIKEGRLNADAVVDYYRTANRDRLREDVVKMIGLYPSWQEKLLSASAVGELDWYLDEDPGHVSHLLTQSGKEKKVSKVAKTYVANRSKFLETWSGARKIEKMVKVLKAGKKLSPIIIVEGERYPNSPESSFIDGVHRALAFAVFAIDSDQPNLSQSAFVGKKSDLTTRAMRRVGLLK